MKLNVKTDNPIIINVAETIFIRPILSDSVPRMILPTVLKIAIIATALAAVAALSPTSCTPISFTILIKYRPPIHDVNSIKNKRYTCFVRIISRGV